MIILPDRTIIEIAGEDRKKFLQGLITNDVNNASDSNLIYSAMLNAKGRFLYDFFIFEKAETLFLDCHNNQCDDIIKKLNLYKLRAKITINKNDNLRVIHSFTRGDFTDPRHKDLGFRSYQTDISYPQDDSSYHQKRIFLKIPEGEYDLTYEKSLILEFNFDNLNAINYQKGCYVGQELTARTHYRGEIRKKIFHIKIPQFTEKDSATNLKGSEITCEGKSTGVILSSVFIDSELHALALLKLPTSDSPINENIEFQNQKIFIIS